MLQTLEFCQVLIYFSSDLFSGVEVVDDVNCYKTMSDQPFTWQLAIIKTFRTSSRCLVFLETLLSVSGTTRKSPYESLRKKRQD